MPRAIDPFRIQDIPSFWQLYRPIVKATVGMPPLLARGNRPLKMTFEEQLKALIFFHLEEHIHHFQSFFEGDLAHYIFSPTINFSMSTGVIMSRPLSLALSISAGRSPVTLLSV